MGKDIEAWLPGSRRLSKLVNIVKGLSLELGDSQSLVGVEGVVTTDALICGGVVADEDGGDHLRTSQYSRIPQSGGSIYLILHYQCFSITRLRREHWLVNVTAFGKSKLGQHVPARSLHMRDTTGAIRLIFG